MLLIITILHEMSREIRQSLRGKTGAVENHREELLSDSHIIIINIGLLDTILLSVSRK